MRVLFDHQIFSYQAFGGASRYYCELMAAFARDGHPQFELGVAESPNEYLAHASFYRGRKVGKQGVPRFLRTYARNAVETTLASRRRQHDIFHATFYDPGVLRDVRSGKLVVTILDMIPERFPELFSGDGLYNRFVTQRWIAGKRTLCERADAILAISEATKRDVVEIYGTDPDRITVTHLGNSLTADANATPLAGLPERYVLFVGQRGLYKNFEIVVAAAAAIDSDVVAIGGGALTSDEQAMLARHGMSSRVVQRSVGDLELASCYAHALAFVFPSRYEGFGIPIIEALACGCPTLLANASCFPEIGGDACLYFDPDSTDELAAALQRVRDDGALRASLHDKGLIRARQFTWDATAARTLEAYKAVLA